MNWDDIRHLEAIDRLGSVAAAARELGISVSTTYRRVAALEESVAELCLVRGAEPVTLTERGRALAAVGRSMRLGIAEVAGAARAKETQMSGEVSLTTVEGFLPYLLDPIAELTARDPGLRVALHLGESGPSVRDREVDVAIGVMRRPPPGCWGRRVLRIRYGVFGTKEACARAPAPRWVVTGPSLRHTPEAEWERKHAIDVAATASRTAMIALLVRGVGIGLVPRITAKTHPELIEVKAHRASTAHLERVAWVLTHPDSKKSPRIVALMQALTAALSAVGR